MTNLPVLTSGEIVLRPLDEKDITALFRLFSQDDVTRYMDIDSFTNSEEAAQIITYFRDAYEKGEGMRWAIAFADNDELIGTCGYHHRHHEHRKAEIGYDLLPEYWGKGIMTVAVNRMLRYGFNEMALNRIEAFVDPANTPSSRLLHRLGFRQEGLLLDAFFEKGQFVDAVLYSILKREYDHLNCV